MYQGIAMLGYLRSTMTNLKNLQINFFMTLKSAIQKKVRDATYSRDEVLLFKNSSILL